MPVNTRRVFALFASLGTVAAGLGLRRFAAGVVAKLGGVALWSTLVYWLIVMARPRASRDRIARWAVGISWAVELLQLTPWPAALEARWPPVHLVLGSTFSATDLVAYPVGVLLARAMDRSPAA